MQPIRFRAILAAALAGALGLGAPASGVQAQQVVRVDVGAAGAQSLSLPRGESAVIELPVDARDVLVSNPAVADAVLQSPRRIILMGLAPGATDALFFDAAGRQILTLNVRVGASTNALQDTISRLLPGSNVRAEAVNGAVILTGEVDSDADAERAQRVAAQFVERPEQVLNMISVRGSSQVMVQVRVVEMQRNIVEQLGIRLNGSINSGGDPSWVLANTPGFPVNSGQMGGGAFTFNSPASLGGNGLSATLQAFERVGIVRVLSEPHVTTVSGEEADFLAGGEFPVLSGVDDQGNPIITFRDFGVGLNVTPVVLSGGRISLRMSVEVSDLTNNGAFSLGVGNGNTLVVPALNVRRVSNTVEIPSGQSLMIGGLLQSVTRENIDSLPGLTGLPVLGALFRSRDYLQGETELVVIVTPYLVNPTDPSRLQTPVDGLQIASDAETIFFGRLNRAYRPDQPAPQGAWQGPVGYVIE
ncbi:type II and III secretion system protein family protein [Brevundimonas sp.]|uniref:type II and III secretion system protein family protein n=1 Tax=Brevundimonas sp. TaxID=1871086 RepID=UPI0025CD00F2|nr:type II and III secretion system protein family protein [Brevundimonas sp.]